MFSGCGGMDIGFCGGFSFFGRWYEKHPFRIVWANDVNEAACRTYRRNLKHNIHCGDVWDCLETLPKKIDILIGGFPCQDISINGKGRGVAGSRSGLYRAMIKAVESGKPKIVVMENVKGLLLRSRLKSLQKVVGDLSALGYNVSFQLYKAVNYGVPQNRERVFIVGTLPGVRSFTPPDPERDKSSWMTAGEALKDLEDLKEDPAIKAQSKGIVVSMQLSQVTQYAPSVTAIFSIITASHGAFPCVKQLDYNRFPTSLSLTRN
jgi:DNA (cytosine-5)-methyltransferase 1